MPDLISVIVPVYNSEQNLSKCIESLIVQTYEDIQIILVNDGSKDASLEVCRYYKKKDLRINIVNKENGGVGSARNFGIKKAYGTYICFVDADDYVKPDFVENLYGLTKKYQAELAICGFTELKNGEIISETRGDIQIMTQAEAMENLLKQTSFRGYVWNKMFAIDIIKKNNVYFDESLAVWEDVLFVFTYIKYIRKIAYNPISMYNYVFWESSTSHQRDHLEVVERSYSAIMAKDEILKLIPHEYDKVKRQFDVRYVQSALSVLRNVGYVKLDFNSKFYKRSIEILREHGKRMLPYLSSKECLLVKMFIINPAILLLLYRIKSKISK
jgi:glycosyltransferase involved in cell wall biosynthesis